MLSNNQNPPAPESCPTCGPDCACTETPKSSRLKYIVPVVGLLAAAGILGYKLLLPKQTLVKPATDTYMTNPACIPAATNIASPAQTIPDKQPEAAPVVMKAAPAPKPVVTTVKVGESLESLAALNKVAMDKDAVFVVIPAKDEEKVSRATANVVNESQKAIEAQGIKVGVYTLSSSSPEYANLAARVTIPGLLVMSKGKSAAGVKGDLTKDKIIQAFVASSSASSCCGASSSGCK